MNTNNKISFVKCKIKHLDFSIFNIFIVVVGYPKISNSMLSYQNLVRDQTIFLAENKNYNLQEIRSGGTIFFTERQQRNCYLSVAGIVKISRIEPTGKEFFIALLPEKSLFGLLTLLSDKSESTYHATAWTPVSIRAIPIYELQKSPELLTLVTRKLLSRLSNAEMIVESRMRGNLENKLVCCLLILSHDFGVETDLGIKINLPLSHQALAEFINTNRSSITRIIGQLKQQQLISIDQQKITLHDPDFLRRHFAVHG